MMSKGELVLYAIHSFGKHPQKLKGVRASQLRKECAACNGRVTACVVVSEEACEVRRSMVATNREQGATITASPQQGRRYVPVRYL